MNATKYTLTVLAITYGAILDFSFLSFCWFSIVECTVADNISFKEASFPAFVVFLLSCVIGVAVAIGCLVAVGLVRIENSRTRWITSPFVGILLSILVRFASDRVPSTATHIGLIDLGYIPFVLAGAIVGLMSAFVGRER